MTTASEWLAIAEAEKLWAKQAAEAGLTKLARDWARAAATSEQNAREAN